MNVKIITDSGSDLPKEYIEKYKINVIPLEITIGNDTFIDGVTLSNEEFYHKMNASKSLPKTASPSPQSFLEHFECEEENIYIVTLSSKLSSTYNNAMLAKQMYENDESNKNIFIIDSLSASVGEGLVVLKVAELLEKGLEYNDVYEKGKKYAEECQVYFLLEELDNIVKGGRIGKAAGHVASLLSIKLILKSDGTGEVDLEEKARGTKRAFKRFVDIVGEKVTDQRGRTLAIAHGNCYEKALEFKSIAEEKYNFSNIIMSKIGATIGTYSGDGGLLISIL